MGYITRSGPGKRYLYYKESRRVGKKITTPVSIYLGPAGGPKALVSLLSATSRAYLAKSDAALFEKTAPVEVPLVVADLIIGEQQTAEQSFLHEAGISPSSSESEQGSSSEDQSEA
jgi:hypothetical protein